MYTQDAAHHKAMFLNYGGYVYSPCTDFPRFVGYTTSWDPCDPAYIIMNIPNKIPNIIPT